MTDINTNFEAQNLFADMQQPTETRIFAEPPPPPPEIVEPEPEIKPKIDISNDMVDATASIILGVADGLTNTIFKHLWRRKKKTLANEITESETGLLQLKKAVNKASANHAKGYNALEGLTEKETALLNANEEIESYVADLPFTDAEKRNIEIPLKELVKKNGGVIPTEVALMLAFGTCIASRIGELQTV